MTKKTNAPTDDLESGRIAFLKRLKEEALEQEWTSDRSELIDIIDTFDDGGYCA